MGGSKANRRRGRRLIARISRGRLFCGCGLRVLIAVPIAFHPKSQLPEEIHHETDNSKIT